MEKNQNKKYEYSLDVVSVSIILFQKYERKTLFLRMVISNSLKISK